MSAYKSYLYISQKTAYQGVECVLVAGKVWSEWRHTPCVFGRSNEIKNWSCKNLNALSYEEQDKNWIYWINPGFPVSTKRSSYRYYRNIVFNAKASKEKITRKTLYYCIKEWCKDKYNVPDSGQKGVLRWRFILIFYIHTTGYLPLWTARQGRLTRLKSNLIGENNTF